MWGSVAGPLHSQGRCGWVGGRDHNGVARLCRSPGAGAGEEGGWEKLGS